MKRFIKRLLKFSVFLIIPFLALLVLYVKMDPFKVIKSYDSFYDANKNVWVALNKDFVSTTTFIKNSKHTNYNSFIFGNSRSVFYQIDDWKKYLEPGSKCFHFDAALESLWALNKKIVFIDKHGFNLDNVLIVLDHSIIAQDKPRSGHLLITSPPLVNNSNLLEFHKTFFFAFLSPDFFYAYMDFKQSGELKPYMKKSGLLTDLPQQYDITTNEIRLEHFENLIKEERYYTPELLSLFYDRDSLTQSHSPQNILAAQKKLFENIQSIFQKHNSKVKVIISPLYDQMKLNESDLIYLKDTFGEDNVFDFSGINEFTNDYRNYYEISHYRPHVARKILEIVYE
jgi:hypothetical protein